MSDERSNRGLRPRTAEQILSHPSDVWILAAVAAGRVIRARTHLNAPHLLDNKPLPVDLKRLVREELIWAPIGRDPSIAPRGTRLLGLAWGGIPSPLQE